MLDGIWDLIAYVLSTRMREHHDRARARLARPFGSRPKGKEEGVQGFKANCDVWDGI